MKILIMGEYSGRVRDALRGGGHDAVSCDFIPTERPGPHYQGDVRDIILDGWGAMIAFPDCTYLCGSGLHWNGRPDRKEADRPQKTEEALEFVAWLANQPIKHIAWENPIGCISTRIMQEWDGEDGHFYRVVPLGTKIRSDQRIPSQTIQPHDVGDDASKATVIFRKALPPLVLDPVKRFPGRWVIDPRNGKLVERWSNQTDSGQNRLGPSDTRAKDRAETYPGIANIIGEQWGRYLHEKTL